MKKSTLAKYLRAPSPGTVLRSATSEAAMTAEAPLTSADSYFFQKYPGKKSGAGVWQQIISQMPPHDLYVEAFAGTGQVLLHKRPAGSSIAIESDAAVCAALRTQLRSVLATSSEGVTVVCADALAWLEKHRGKLNSQTVVYCDPPYLFSMRSDPGRRYYGHEFGEEWLHGELLDVLSRLSTQRVHVLISGYRSELYDRMLAHWRRVDYRTATRGGGVTESLWCNFDAPAQLHDYRWLGTNFRERERLKRKKARWLAKLRMTPVESAAVIAAIDEWRRQP